MRRFIYFLLVSVVFLFSSCKNVDPNYDAEGDIEKGEIHLLSFGLNLPSFNQFKVKKQIDSLKTLYGFEYNNRGCMPDSESFAKAGKYNEIVIAYLSTRNGNGWYEKYKKQVDSLYKLADDRKYSITP